MCHIRIDPQQHMCNHLDIPGECRIICVKVRAPVEIVLFWNMKQSDIELIS